MRKTTRKTPTKTFQCEDALWERVQAIAEDRGRELSLDPSRLASSVVRTAVEHYVTWYEQQKAAKAKFDAEFDRANAGGKRESPQRFVQQKQK
jgi:hypothetical protein